MPENTYKKKQPAVSDRLHDIFDFLLRFLKATISLACRIYPAGHHQPKKPTLL
jgi:hypothetical protein